MKILKLDKRYFLNAHAGHTHQLRWSWGEFRLREIQTVRDHLIKTYREPEWVKKNVESGDWWLGWEHSDRRGDYIISLPNEKLLTMALLVL